MIKTCDKHGTVYYKQCRECCHDLAKAEKQSAKEESKRQKAISKAKLKSSQPRTKVNKISEKQKGRIAEYNKLAEKFKKENPECQIKANEYCTGITDDVHHPEGKIGNKLFEVEKFKATCRSCHTYIHDHSKESEEKGWTKSRLAIDQTKPVI